jgi:PhnB protein
VIKVNAYLNFEGRAEDAFNFYRSIFGGEFRTIMRFKDMPMPGEKLRKEDENKIMHIALPIGNDVLMASDVPPESLGRKFARGNNVYISVSTESKEEAGRIFKALSAGGRMEMPIADMPWGAYYGSLKDKFGVMWMVEYTYPKTS